MGNKLVNISPSEKPGETVQEGDILATIQPIETDEIFKTLGQTNDDIAEIASNLKVFSEKMNDPTSFWGLLSDTILTKTISQSVQEIQQSSQYAVTITQDLSSIVSNVKAGKGTIGELLNDTIFSVKLNQTMTNLQAVSDSLLTVANNLQLVSAQITNGEGAVGTVLTDSTFEDNLTETMENLKKSSALLEENLEALKHNILFKRYFKKQEKEAGE